MTARDYRVFAVTMGEINGRGSEAMSLNEHSSGGDFAELCISMFLVSVLMILFGCSLLKNNFRKDKRFHCQMTSN